MIQRQNVIKLCSASMKISITVTVMTKPVSPSDKTTDEPKCTEWPKSGFCFPEKVVHPLQFESSQTMASATV